MNRRRKRFFVLLLFLACLFSALLILCRLWMYAESALFFRRMRETAELAEFGQEELPADEAEDPDSGSAGSMMPADTAVIGGDGYPADAIVIEGDGWPADGVVIDWKAFRGMNVRAWLRFGGISYPVMQGKDNSFYLHRLPDGTANAGGSLFLLAENNGKFKDRNSIIYGHNMADGSMFGSLKKMKKKPASVHYFDLYLPDGSLHRYALFAILCVQADANAFFIRFPDSKDYVHWQKEMKELSVCRCPAPVSEEGKMVTLVTCDGPAGTSRRLAVIGEEMRVWKQPRSLMCAQSGSQKVEGEGSQKVEGEGSQTDKKEGSQRVEEEGSQTDKKEGSQKVEEEGSRTDKSEGSQMDKREGSRTDEGEDR